MIRELHVRLTVGKSSQIKYSTVNRLLGLRVWAPSIAPGVGGGGGPGGQQGRLLPEAPAIAGSCGKLRQVT